MDKNTLELDILRNVKTHDADFRLILCPCDSRAQDFEEYDKLTDGQKMTLISKKKVSLIAHGLLNSIEEVEEVRKFLMKTNLDFFTKHDNNPLPLFKRE
jgi:hypothetical protein